VAHASLVLAFVALVAAPAAVHPNSEAVSVLDRESIARPFQEGPAACENGHKTMAA